MSNNNKVTNKYNFVNLTARTIHEVNSNMTIEPSGIVARIDHDVTRCISINNVPTFTKQIKEATNLPDSKYGTYYIVYSIILNNSNRTDLLATGSLVKRDGRIIGCSGFIRNSNNSTTKSDLKAMKMDLYEILDISVKDNNAQYTYILIVPATEPVDELTIIKSLCKTFNIAIDSITDTSLIDFKARLMAYILDLQLELKYAGKHSGKLYITIDKDMGDKLGSVNSSENIVKLKGTNGLCRDKKNAKSLREHLKNLLHF